MKAYTDLFVDFDDTLYDTHGNAIIALAELYDAMHLDRHFARLEDFTEPYWKTNVVLWGQYSRGEVSRDYLMVERFRRPLSLGEGLEPDREYCMKVSDMFLDFCACKPGLVEGARELLDYLQPRYRLHLCSNGFHEVQYRKLDASDTRRYFTSIILSEDAGVNKPAAAFFDYALRTSGAEKASTLMIGDNYVTDIQGAAAAGFDTILFNRWQDNKPEDDVAKWRVDNLLEIKDIL